MRPRSNRIPSSGDGPRYETAEAVQAGPRSWSDAFGRVRLKRRLKLLKRNAAETWDGINLLFGRYRPLLRIDFDRIERLVFVCQGNVCRSPFGDGVAKRLGIASESCGLSVLRRRPPPSTATAAARLRNIDISSHYSQPITDLKLSATDCIIAMEPRHLEKLAGVPGFRECQTTLLGLWNAPAIVAIRDPYGADLDTFSECYRLIESSLSRFAVNLPSHRQTVRQPLRD